MPRASLASISQTTQLLDTGHRLELQRRHTSGCPHKDKGPGYTKCTCPIWLYGRSNGKRYRRSLGLRDWSRAQKRLDRINETPSTISDPRTLSECIDVYIADCRARKVEESTLVSYRRTLNHLLAYGQAHKLTYIEDFDLDTLTSFRSQRDVKGTTGRKELEHLRTFQAFCVKRRWIAENHAKELTPPKQEREPTLPYTQAEVERLIAACDQLSDGNPGTMQRTRARGRAFILTLLYSGLRISDVIALERRSLDTTSGKLLLPWTQKTGQGVYVRLHPSCVQALQALPGESQCFFWNGTGKLQTAIGNARKTFDRICEKASIPKGHPHRTRDTFAVSLLDLGAGLRDVQILLGHSSIRVTEKYYAPWVLSSQERLDSFTGKLNFESKASTKTATRRRKTA